MINSHPDTAGRRERRHPHRPLRPSKFPTRFDGQIRGFHTEGYIDGKSDRRLYDYLRYCIVSGKKALESVNLGGERLDKAETVEIRFKCNSRWRRKATAAEAGRQQKKQAPKDWESMSLSEKAVGLYVGEKGLLFWLNKFAYTSIFIVIGG